MSVEKPEQNVPGADIRRGSQLFSQVVVGESVVEPVGIYISLRSRGEKIEVILRIVLYERRRALQIRGRAGDFHRTGIAIDGEAVDGVLVRERLGNEGAWDRISEAAGGRVEGERRAEVHALKIYCGRDGERIHRLDLKRNAGPIGFLG